MERNELSDAVMQCYARQAVGSAAKDAAGDFSVKLSGASLPRHSLNRQILQVLEPPSKVPDYYCPSIYEYSHPIEETKRNVLGLEIL